SGWTLFKAAPGTWIGLTVVFMLVMMVMALIPFLGGIALNLLMPVFIGGIMMGCKAIEDGEELRVGHLFAAFSGHVGNLVIVGLLYMVGIFAIMMVMFVIGGAGFGIGALLGGNIGTALVPMILLGLLALALMIPLAMAVWFAPPLIIFHEVPPFEAMKASFVVCLKNFVPFLVYGLVYLVLAVLACIPIFLGWLVLAPVMMASMYAGYRDMFTRD
ncbi:MAG: BPSS1780 family membrane protein, partial [Betaproteobacteria bacterium]